MVEPSRPSAPISRTIAGSYCLVAIGREHARKQLLLRIIARGVAHHALFLGQLAFEVERILPFERGVLDLGGFGVAFFRFFRELGHCICSLNAGAKLRSAPAQAASAVAVAAPAAFRYLGRDAVPFAPVAQLDRALPSEGRGQGFESLRARQ